MSGGAQAQGSTGLGSSQASGIDTSNMPQWQKGLYGTLTGNSQFGQNAPMIHQLFQQGVQGMQQPRPQLMQPPMQGGGPPGAPPGLQPMPRPPVQGQMPGQGMPPQMGQGPQMGGQQLTPAMLNQMLAARSGLMGG